MSEHFESIVHGTVRTRRHSQARSCRPAQCCRFGTVPYPSFPFCASPSFHNRSHCHAAIQHTSGTLLQPRSHYAHWLNRALFVQQMFKELWCFVFLSIFAVRKQPKGSVGTIIYTRSQPGRPLRFHCSLALLECRRRRGCRRCTVLGPSGYVCVCVLCVNDSVPGWTDWREAQFK